METINSPIKVSFENLDYKVNTKQEVQHILKNVTGYAPPGQSTYIMGASGAGKTTLLNALSGRIRLDSKAKMSGKAHINDSMPLTTSSFSKYGAYVM